MIQLHKRFLSALAERRLQQFKKFKAAPVPTKSAYTQEDFWHSSAHLLGWAMEKKYGDDCLLTHGPATHEGFFYDAFLFNGSTWSSDRLQKINSDVSSILKPQQISSDINELLTGKYGSSYFVTEDDLKDLTKVMSSLAKTKQPFEYITVDRETAQEMFSGSPFKLALISRIPDSQKITVFRCGDFVDLRRGPHIPNSDLIKSIMLSKTGAAQWSKEYGQNMSRVMGISFDSHNGLKEYRKLQIEAEKRNHRTIGKRQGLVAFHPHSPGSPFFLPHGTRIIQSLYNYLRQEYRKYGFQEVVTPLIFNKELWETSGHWQNYKDDMFIVSGGCNHSEDSEINGLKPMNCPGHCLLYSNSAKSYRDLPLRFAEFSPLHRNEASGALTGLTRVRKFHQDDGHIFCTKEQIHSEIKATLNFVEETYKILGFQSYSLTLSTRPESNFMGSLADWDVAEESLKEALNSTGQNWTLKEGDGAFYGPKIDIMVTDCLNRSHQTATIQLDFQLPERFNLLYQDATGGFSRPVIIHRAILGSIERMLAIMTENYSGKWPFWISPRQMLIITTRPEIDGYAIKVQQQLKEFYVDYEKSDNTLAKQIRDAQKLDYNFILVLGDREEQDQVVTVRARDGTNVGTIHLESFKNMCKELVQNYQ
ncbi:54S ribosomal protein L39, mitochondrial [Boothiomyces macroporosus]|uniref:threonine--tRNA ligase n=1 Tax=Boothiomyces macroporosus TaxID=261099 RepID=A0AAD5UHW3_9FUNG|nr:54S ribosomal protein L39, mitochondrial [Boothiomyces macroporosus]